MNAAPDGATILVGPGTFRERIQLTGKRLRIIGNGARGESRTEIIADAPREVVPADQVSGLITYFAVAGGELRGVSLVGGDAAIVGAGGEQRAGDLIVKEVVIRQSGRGILWQHSGKLVVQSVDISDLLWHGIVLNGSDASIIIDSILVGALGAVGSTGFEIYVLGSGCATIQNDQIVNGSKGGVGVLNSCVEILDSYFNLNRTAHVWSRDSQTSISNSEFHYSQCVELSDGSCIDGDSLVFLGGSGAVQNSSIDHAARAGIGVYGATISLASTDITCSPFDVDLETFQSVPGLVSYDKGNLCGCPDPTIACLGVSAGLAPPDPVGPPP